MKSVAASSVIVAATAPRGWRSRWSGRIRGSRSGLVDRIALPLMRRWSPRTGAKKKPGTFRVSASEKVELLAAVKEADQGGALPFDEAMAEVERMTDEILDVVRVPPSAPK